MRRAHTFDVGTTPDLAGGDVKVLQRMLGHASAALTLDRYGHLLPGQAHSVADRLDKMARAAKVEPVASVTPLPAAGYFAGRDAAKCLVNANRWDVPP